MPEELLLELETTAPIAGNLEKIEDTLRGVLNELGLIVEQQKGIASAFENAWRQIILNVARGQTADVQAARPRLLSAFEKQLDRLKRTHALLSELPKRGQANLSASDALLGEISSMERLKARVFDPWQSADDLEDLAARDYPLTTAELDQIGPQRRPPASYYAEESKPF